MIPSDDISAHIQFLVSYNGDGSDNVRSDIHQWLLYDFYFNGGFTSQNNADWTRTRLKTTCTNAEQTKLAQTLATRYWMCTWMMERERKTMGSWQDYSSMPTRVSTW